MWHIAIMGNRVFVFAFALAITFPGAIADAGAVNHVPLADLAESLEIRAESPAPRYSVPERFHFVVTIRNRAKNALVILPGGIRRVYKALDRGSAGYVPFPGPPLSPWRNAFLLFPGESRTMEFQGMRDGDGVWMLDPGEYLLAIRMTVSADVANSPDFRSSWPGIPVWHGECASEPTPVTYRPDFDKVTP